MRLYNLVADVFAIVTSFLEFQDIYRLSVTCGPMNRAITSTGAVTNVYSHLEYGASELPSLIYRLPSISSVLLDVHQYERRPVLPEGVEHPCAFGKGLKTLFITGPAGIVFLHSLTYNFTREASSYHSNSYDIGKALPNLEKLSLIGNQRSQLLPSIIETLPRSLTSLKLDICYLHQVFHAPKHLINLTHLDIPKCTSFQDESFSLEQLPNLTSISLPDYRQEIKLNAQMVDLAIISTPLTPTWARKVPNLTSLKLSTEFFQLAEITQLPHLTSLQLVNMPDPETTIPSLPPTLTELGITKWVKEDLTIFCLLPASLTRFICSTLKYPENFDDFLNSWNRRREQTDLALPTWFPAGLKTWSVYAQSYSTAISKQYWQLLPSSITQLSASCVLSAALLPSEPLDTVVDFASAFPKITILSVGAGPMSSASSSRLILPSCLTRLLMRRLHVPFSSQLHILPETLTSLTVEEDYFQPAAITPLPPNLTFLSFTSSNMFGGTKIPGNLGWYFASESFSQSLEKLPPSLRELYLTVRVYVPVTQKLLESLPKKLETAYVNCFHELTDAFVPHLPRSLKALSLRHSNSVSDAGMLLLPPLIETLVMKNNRAVTPACLPHLPRKLAYLSLAKNRNFPRALHASIRKEGVLTIKTQKLDVAQ